MTDQDPTRCAAITKAGNRCKNPAQEGSLYCHIHQRYTPEETVTTAAPAPSAEEVELQTLVAELNQVATELHQAVPDYAPPPYSPQGMLSLLRSNVDRFAPEAVHNLQSALEGTTMEDFRDLETWKGMWFTLNYLVQLEASERTAGLRRRLSALPGVNTLADLKAMLADTPPEEFLKIDTWKGMWFIANYEMQQQAQSLRRRLFGGEEEDEA